MARPGLPGKGETRPRGRVAAPVVLLGGIGVVTGARRAHDMKEYLTTFADSLKHGAGPLELKVKFVPFYVDGQRLGIVDALRIERHAAGTVDSLHLEVHPRLRVALADMAKACHMLFTSFDPDDFKHALSCEPEAGDNVRSGSVSVRQGNATIPLTCRPWTMPARRKTERGKRATPLARPSAPKSRPSSREPGRKCTAPAQECSSASASRSGAT